MIRVGAIQVDCSKSIEEIKASINKMTKEAAEKGAKIVCLPEHWIPGKKPDLADMLPFLTDIAMSSRVNLISGADFYARDNKITVESIIISPDGSEVGRQSKVHLFGREKDIAKGGDNYNIFEVAGLKIAVAICHDMVYPEVARIYALKGAEIIFSPARIPYYGLEPWYLYLKARALENRLPVVSPNCCGDAVYRGGSIIVGLKNSDKNIVYPVVLAESEKGECLLIADIDVETAKKLREERLSNRRSDTYSLLAKV